jgi:lipoate-protein ligase A
MLLYRNSNTEPSLNLALEEWLLQEAVEDCFMLWRNRPSIIVGRNQNTVAEINREYVEANKIPVVRRLSGGGAVYHDLGNLNYTFIVNGTKNRFDFRHFAEPVIAVLRQLGAKAEYSGRNDMIIEGKKFSGNAQYIQGNKVLHHGTLLFQSDLTILEKALNVSPDKYQSKGVKSVASRVTNIAPHLSAPCNVEGFMEALFSHMKNTFPGATFADLTESEYNGAGNLVNSRYGNREWNFGRSFAYNFRNSMRFPGGHIECQILVDSGKIKAIKIYGDFFGVKPVEDLELTLTGVQHDYEAINLALKDVELADYFVGIEREAIIKMFL